MLSDVQDERMDNHVVYDTLPDTFIADSKGKTLPLLESEHRASGKTTASMILRSDAVFTDDCNVAISSCFITGALSNDAKLQVDGDSLMLANRSFLHSSNRRGTKTS